MNTVVIIILSLVLSINLTFAQTASLKSVSDQFVTISTRETLTRPEVLHTMWVDTYVPLSAYSEKARVMQQHINEQTEEIVTYATSDKEAWTEIDFEPITPFTWKWIDLELIRADQTKSQISLRRPNSWIEKLGATKIGNEVYIDMPDMGINGIATVVNIRVNQLDTRLWNYEQKGNYVKKPITGKFIHHSDDVYDLYFEGNTKPLGVTGNHLIWSLDQNGWVPANTLYVGEHVKTQTGNSKLTKKKKLSDIHQVYNLEVYKDHNYQVSLASILVHNECWNEFWTTLHSAFWRQSYLDPDSKIKVLGNSDYVFYDMVMPDEPFRVYRAPWAEYDEASLTKLNELAKMYDADKIVIKQSSSSLDTKDKAYLEKLGYKISFEKKRSNVGDGGGKPHIILTKELKD